MQLTVIETKLRPPQNATRLLVRDNLNSRLIEAADNGHITTVVAPAGSGKSTLLTGLYQALAAKGFSAHWFSLEQSNDAPLNFAQHLFEALASVNPSLVKNQLAQMRAIHENDTATVFEQLTTFIAAQTGRIAIFLDDCHLITSPEIQAFLSRLLGYLPTNIHIVLASRRNMDIDLNRRRMAGTLLEIRPADINLPPLELAKYLREVHQLELEPQELSALYQTTEGWFAGLQLAAMTIKSAPSRAAEIINGFAAQDKNLKQYMFRSVLESLPPKLREFLLLTSPLTKMSIDLCNAVTEGNDAAAYLEDIDSRNLFLIPLDHQNQWYRYHHLFAEFLQNELTQQNPQKHESVLIAAASWCIEAGMLTSAIQYFLSAGAYQQAVELINNNATNVALDDGDHAKILDWMRRLPKEFHDNNPSLLLNHAISRAFSRDVPKAKTLCGQAIELLENETGTTKLLTSEERTYLQWYSQVVATISDAALDKTRSGIDNSKTLLDALPENDHVLRASTANTLSYCYLVQGKLKMSAQYANLAYKVGVLGNTIYSTVWALFLTGANDIELGRLHSAQEAADQAASHIRDSDSSGLYSKALATLTQVDVYIQHCEFSRAYQTLTEQSVLSGIYGPCELLIRAYKNEARQQAWRGLLGLARQTLHQAQNIGLTINSQRLYLTMAAEEITLQLLFDSYASAMDTVRRTELLTAVPDEINKENKAAITELQRLTEARLKLENSENTAAQALLYPLLRSAENDGRVLMVIQLRALRSVAMWNDNKRREASRELDKALNAACEEGCIYAIASAGNGLIAVLDQIQDQWGEVSQRDAAQTKKRAFALRLRAVICQEAETSTISVVNSAKKVEPVVEKSEFEDDLTNRELELLRLIAAGLNNKELAQELFISVTTAKWHLQNIFRKLGVRNRNAAVAVARKAQLIS